MWLSPKWGARCGSLVEDYRGFEVVGFGVVVVDRNERQGKKMATLVDDGGRIKNTTFGEIQGETELR